MLPPDATESAHARASALAPSCCTALMAASASD